MKFRDDALLTIEEVAEAVGYAPDYLRTMTAEGSVNYDPTLYRLRIKTDETYRKAYGTKVQYVYQYSDVRRWFNERQERPTVQVWNEGRGVIVE